MYSQFPETVPAKQFKRVVHVLMFFATIFIAMMTPSKLFAGSGAAGVYTVADAPTVQASAVTFENPSGTAVSTFATWTSGNGASRAVFIAQASTGSPAPVDGTSYTANTTFGSGTQIGNTGWFCVYNGSGSSTGIDGLTGGTNYRVMVVEYNGTAGSQQYLTTAGTGNPSNFTTPSNDARLTGIRTNPIFNLTNTGTSGSTTTYTASVPNTISSATFTSTTQDPGATIKVNGVTVTSGMPSGSIAFAVGQTTINIVVTAIDGTTTQTYSITVTRPPLGNAILSSIKLTPASVLTNTGTSGNTTTYTTTINSHTASITITPTAVDPDATITVNGVAVASGTASGAIIIGLGQSTINTVVTASDGVTTRNYSIITTKLSYNAVLSSIKLTPASSLTNTGTSGTTTTYTTTANSATASVKVTPTAVDPNATIKVNGVAVASGTLSGAIAIPVGHTTITILVTAQDKSTRTYSITVTRLSNNALLSSIKLTPASTLTNTGTSNGTTTFSTSVPNSETSVKLTPTTANGSATVKVNGVAVASGTASGSIALAVGSNTINTVVTAQDGTTFRYTITATRASGPLHDLYLPISVVQPTDVVAIETDGVMVHQGVSPNGDGINDFLTIDGIIAYPDNSLQIIDRSGTLIYQAKGYNNVSSVFDGHSGINGRMQQPGTYFYSLDYVADGQSKHKTGYIVLKY